MSCIVFPAGTSDNLLNIDAVSQMCLSCTEGNTVEAAHRLGLSFSPIVDLSSNRGGLKTIFSQAQVLSSQPDSQPCDREE
jgi:hypothetical protein